MINLCLVVIATQFSETKRRETERMIAERRRFSRSSSTLLSTSDSDPGSCWEELIKLIGHLIRRTHRRVLKKYALMKKNKVEVIFNPNNFLFYFLSYQIKINLIILERI